MVGYRAIGHAATEPPFGGFAMNSRIVVVLALCLAFGATAWADTFRLKPGHEHNGQSTLEGKKLGQTGTKWIIKLDSGGVVTIEASHFLEEGGESDAGDPAAELGLAELTFEPLLPEESLQEAVRGAKAALLDCPDMVVLKDGRKLVGTATPTDTGVTINVAGERKDLKTEEISEILPSPARAFQEHLQAAEGGTARNWLDLAQWCLDESMLEEARKAVLCLQVAMTMDPEDVAVRELLGFQRVEGQWLRGEDLAYALGHRMENGKWVAKESAELAAVKDRVMQWGDLETMAYRDALRRVEDDVDAFQIQIGRGDGAFRPWRDSCAVQVSSEERSWGSAKHGTRVSTVMAYAKRYASANKQTRREERAKVLEFEQRDLGDIMNCAECGGQVKYQAQEPCPTCGGGSDGPAKCPQCKGDGRANCRKCGGDGKVNCRECAKGVKSNGTSFYD